MDEEQTAGYREPCAVCSAVDWGVSDEGRFYCRSCHNVIERTREVVDPNLALGSSRISTIGRGSRTKRAERGRQWLVCEGFQFILRSQADALLALGVSPHFKDGVLCELWRRFLQRSRQAFTHNSVSSCSFRVRSVVSSDSAAEASAPSSETEGGDVSSAAGSSDWSLCSGSLDATSYLSPRRQPTAHAPMSMKRTLALIHLALTWTREPLTLSDLLRLVNEGHVPYVNAYQELPEEMKLEGKDALIFRVKRVPSHRSLHTEAQTLLLFLQLPAFPPISRQSLLHPALLSLRYLADANLPDQLHPWLCRLMDCAGMGDPWQTRTGSVPVLPRCEVQAAALVVVTVKLLFGLDDHVEWDLSNEAADQDQDHGGSVFSLRRWFRLLQAALAAARHREEDATARRRWAAEHRLLFPYGARKCVVMKQKRTAEQLQRCFEALASRPAVGERGASSSFRFLWGDEDGADGPSLHHQTLQAVLTQDQDDPTPLNASYWHPSLKVCDPKKCPGHYSEASLPRSYVWLLQLFCFLLDLEPQDLHQEVLQIERRLVRSSAAGRRPRPKTRARTRTRTRAVSENGTPQRGQKAGYRA